MAVAVAVTDDKVKFAEAAKNQCEQELENAEVEMQAIVEQRKAFIAVRAEFLGRFVLRGEVLKFMGL